MLTGVAAAAAGLMLGRAGNRARHIPCDQHPALAAGFGSARHCAGERRGCLAPRMKCDSGTLLTLAGFFALTSLFAIGGAKSAIPEIHRFAVDVQHSGCPTGSSPIPLRWRNSRRART